MDFVCPKCKEELYKFDGGVKKCRMGHSFDRAKEGYYNLLLSSVGGVHGDNKDMVLARAAFLSKDFYLPLAEAVAKRVCELTPYLGTVLDAGCGEGYYTDVCERAMSSSGKDSNFLAFDISRDAVRRAAKRNPRVSFSVASSYCMPLPNGSVDTVINIFSPLAGDEVKRVLKKGGSFIFAYPAERHLFGLKRAVYDTPYENKPEDTSLDGFRLLSVDKIDYTLTLTEREDIKNLFMMTPYAYRTSALGRERVESLSYLETEISFRVATYERN